MPVLPLLTRLGLAVQRTKILQGKSCRDKGPVIVSAVDVAKAVLSKVATVLDEPLLQNVAFVGGCTRGLLVTALLQVF